MFQPPGGPQRGPDPYTAPGAFCRVAATRPPRADGSPQSQSGQPVNGAMEVQAVFERAAWLSRFGDTEAFAQLIRRRRALVRDDRSGGVQDDSVSRHPHRQND